MLLGIIAAVLIGCVLGTLTGLAPGLHINLVIALVVASSKLNELFSPISLICFVIALSITHTLLDFIPSIFLGAAEEDNFLSVLPGHELLKRGLGQEAVTIAMIGCASGAIITLILSPVLWLSSIFFFKTLSQTTPWLIIMLLMYTILREEKKLAALFFVILAGFLGFLALHAPVKEPLLPLLGGLFGISGLVTTLQQKIEIPKQERASLGSIRLERRDFVRNTALGALALVPFSILPALGSSYACLMISELKEQSRRGFIYLNGLVNSAIMVSSFVIVYAAGKARTGSAAAMEQILPKINIETILIGGLSLLISVILAFILGILLIRKASMIVQKISYPLLSISAICFVTLVSYLISGPIGLLILFTSASTGLALISSGLRRIHLMSSLIIPTMIIYLA